MELSQDERQKFLELIDKVSPCAAISEKENLEKFKEWLDVALSSFFVLSSKVFFITVLLITITAIHTTRIGKSATNKILYFNFQFSNLLITAYPLSISSLSAIHCDNTSLSFLL